MWVHDLGGVHQCVSTLCAIALRLAQEPIVDFKRIPLRF